MATRRLKRGVVGASTAAATWLFATAAFAQQQPIPPEYYTLDERGVDLVTGQFNYSTSEVVIGQPGAGGLAYGRVALPMGWRDLAAGGISCDPEIINCLVSMDGISEGFTRSGSVYTPTSQRGATLVGTSTQFIFTSADGEQAFFIPIELPYGTNNMGANAGLLMSRVKPNGEQTTYNYKQASFCPQASCTPGELSTAFRLQSITNNFGYQIKYNYHDQNPNEPLFFVVSSVVGLNNAIDYCAAGLDTCPTFSRNWPKVSYARSSDGAGGINEVATDELNRQTVYHLSTANELDRIRLPGQSVDQLSLLRNNGRVSLVNAVSGQWTYGYTDGVGERTTVSTGPQGQQTTVVSDLSVGQPSSITDALNLTTAFSYDDQQRLKRITQPEGDYTEFSYDLRGNVIETVFQPKPNAVPSADPITINADYTTACDNVVICNQPIQTTDRRGGITNYAYDPVHGGVTTVTGPSPDAGQSRPQIRVTYGSRSAWYKQSSGGGVTQAQTAVTLPITTSTCATGNTCANTAQEIVNTLTYGTSGMANNLLPTAATTRAGDNSVSAITAMTYDANGDVVTMDGPLSGTDDTTRILYDAARQMVGVIGPDPDGLGPLKNRAMRNTYRPDGSVSMSEIGTTAGQTDPAWTNFTSLQQSLTNYDTFVRPTDSRFNAGGTAYALTQFSYDASGRPDCEAQRMNPAVFETLPASACTPGTMGAYGPDRIVKRTYDAASQAVSVTSGLGTPEVSTEAVTYTANGLPQTLADGRGNVSTMVYDGFDRMWRMRYPLPGGGGSSTTDYEETTYDEASNVLTSRTRAGQTFSAVYDALNRRMSVTAPAGTDTVNYTYDLLGRPLSATIPGSSPVATTMTWDALSRQTTETGPLGTMAMQYDSAGRRTRLTWPDAFYVTYGYDLTDAMTAIRQGSGSTLIATYGYDDLARRVSVTRGNGVTTAYGYDPASRLTSLSHDLAGTTYDQTYGYTHDTAGAIRSVTRSNSIYDYTGATAGLAGYGINGLNQTTSVGPTSLSHDVNGNLTNDGTRAFGYDAANRLRSTSTNNATLSYDALGRLKEMIGTEGARYIYDGAEVTGAYNNSNMITNRLVRGPWPDELVVAYQGSSTTNQNWSLQDHLGSNIAILQWTGETLINRYDDYGVRQSSNLGRMQYTGQLWMPDFGLYHYKARAYHSGLGRFVQTDPIGYAAGANLYGYVGGDPINWTDPTGLLAQEICVTDSSEPTGEYCTPIGRGTQARSTTFSWTSVLNFLSNADRWPQLPDPLEVLTPTCASGMVCATVDPSMMFPSLRAARTFSIGSKIAKQLAARGWTRSQLRNAIQNPARTVSTRDTRFLPNGTRMNDPATAFYSRQGGYVVRNDVTGDIVQVSPRDLTGWATPW